MADLITGTDAQAWISASSVTTATDTTAEFAALTWTAIGLIESIPERGDESALVEGNVINEGRTRAAKGVRNSGAGPLVCFHDESDAGQTALRAGQLTSNNYGLKISPRDRLSSGGTDSIEYWRIMIMSARKSQLASDGLVRITFNIKFNSQAYEVAAT